MKTKLAFVMAPALAVALGSGSAALADGGLIYDNGSPDGDNGLSMLFDGGFGAMREIADDFVLKGGPGWLVNGHSFSYLWNDGSGLGLFGDFQMEIYADDVRCTHGASVGPLDQEQLFYLLSRGIPRAQAVSLLAHGFVEDVLEAVPDNVRDRLRQHLNDYFVATEIN